MANLGAPEIRPQPMNGLLLCLMLQFVSCSATGTGGSPTASPMASHRPTPPPSRLASGPTAGRATFTLAGPVRIQGTWDAIPASFAGEPNQCGITDGPGHVSLGFLGPAANGIGSLTISTPSAPGTYHASGNQPLHVRVLINVGGSSVHDDVSAPTTSITVGPDGRSGMFSVQGVWAPAGAPVSNTWSRASISGSWRC